MTEIEFQKELCRLANRQGAHAVRIQDRYIVGVPDISMGWAGREFWIEAKLRNGEVTAQQRDFLALRARAGGRCGVLRLYQLGDLSWRWSGAEDEKWFAGPFPAAVDAFLTYLSLP